MDAKKPLPLRTAADFCLLDVTELQQLSEVLDGADHLAGVGVLVVVPGNDLNLSHAVARIFDCALVTFLLTKLNVEKANQKLLAER